MDANIRPARRDFDRDNTPHFDPASTKRQFRIAATDGMVTLFWLSLRKIIERTAPGIDIHAVPYKGDGEALLLNAEVDLVFDFYADSSAQIRTKQMFNNHFVCVMRPGHKFASDNFSLGKFLRSEHIFVSLTGGASGIVDKRLVALNKSRRIAMTVNSLPGAIELLKETDLIAVLPQPTVAQAIANGDLVVRESPIEIPPARISLAWHRRQDHDPGLIWLRGAHLDKIVHEKHDLFERIGIRNCKV